MKKIFLILIMFTLSINVKAFENEIFSIEIPEKYSETLNENNVFKWTLDNNYIAITVNSNKKLKYNIKNYTEENINNQKEYIEKNVNKGLEQYEIKANITNIQKNNIDSLYYLEYDVYYPTKKATGYDIYQKGRMYTTNNYIINIIYNSDKEIKDKNSYSFLNTLIINDNPNVIKTLNYKQIIYTAIFFGIVLAILSYLIQYKRRS